MLLLTSNICYEQIIVIATKINCMKYRIFLTLFLSLINSVLLAQEVKHAELIGDRPDQTESAFVLPKGYVQFEDGFVYENETYNIQNISYSSFLLRYGLIENMELRFGTEYTKVKGIGDNVVGLTPFFAGAKIHVNKEEGWIPQIAFLGHINIAESGYSYFKQDYHSAQMVLTFNHTINELWSFGYSIGVTFPSNVNYAVGTYTFVSGFSISEKMGAFIEAYGDFTKYRYADNKINGGVTYLVHHNIQLDIAGGFGLSDYSPKNYWSIGFIYLFKP